MPEVLYEPARPPYFDELNVGFRSQTEVKTHIAI
jgi:hypothetical protein